MELAIMRYKGFSLRCNPRSVEVISENTNTAYIQPHSGEHNEDLGRKCRIIKGKGELRGEDCLEQYAKLYSLYQKGGKGVLSMPLAEPVVAFFTKLTASADEAPDKISYSFQFTEASSKSPYMQEKVHIVKKGESLFDIAYKYGVEADKLVKLNPNVKRPDELKENEEIRVC